MIPLVNLSDLQRRIGRRIRTARWSLGWTQEETAAQAGITFRHYAELERGRVNPTLRTLFELARLLGRRVAELVDVEPMPRKKQVPLDEVDAKPPKKGRKPRKK